MDQWYLDYGEESWRETALEWVENADGKGLETYSSDTKNGFKSVLGWLNQWACARSYGLGSKLPWDTQFLVGLTSSFLSNLFFFHPLPPSPLFVPLPPSLLPFPSLPGHRI